MSHVAKVDLKIKDIAALEEACGQLGLELMKGQETYKWFGSWQNDYGRENAAYHHGFDPSDYGKCVHAIRVKDANKQTYEIGVCEARDGSGGFVLIWDFWQGGYGLREKVGTGCKNIKREYGKSVARKEVKRLANKYGGSYTEEVNPETNETHMKVHMY